MKAYLTKLAADYKNALEVLCSKDGDAGQDKIKGKLIPGAKCAWCYKEDVDFWKRDDIPYLDKPHQWPYHGFIIPFPDTNGRSEMEAEHVCVVIVDYPIEKENPKTDWATLASILERPELYKFHIFPYVS